MLRSQSKYVMSAIAANRTFGFYQDKIITKAITADGKVFDRATITKTI
jgi:hypothetical protein